MTTEASQVPSEQSVAQQAIANATPAPAAPGAEAPAPADAPEQPNTSFANEDAALAEALRQQDALDKAAGVEGVDPTKPQPVAPQSAPAATQAAVKASSNTVESAVIALRRELTKTKNENLVLTGKVEALQSVALPPAQQQPGSEGAQQAHPAQAEADPLEAIDQQYEAIAEKVDTGELSEVEAEKERRALRQREREILTTQQSAPANDLGLQEHLQQLVADYPLLNKLSKAQLEPFRQLAEERAALQGKPYEDGPLGTKRLRTDMAALAEAFYDPAASVARAQRLRTTAPAPSGKGHAPGSQPGPTPPPTQARTQPNAAERERKLQMASSMPPDVHSIGTGGAVSGDVTAEQGEAILKSFGGNEDAAIRWLESNPSFVNRHMANPPRR